MLNWASDGEMLASSERRIAELASERMMKEVEQYCAVEKQVV